MIWKCYAGGEEFFTDDPLVKAQWVSDGHRVEAALCGWIRAIDEALAISHIGVANEWDSYDVARKKLADLINFEVAIATDHRVNGGYKLVPVEPTAAMLDAAGPEGHANRPYPQDGIAGPRMMREIEYRAMIAAAPSP